MTMEKIFESENLHIKLNVPNTSSNVIVTNQDNLRNNIAEAFYKTEQLNDKMVSEIKDSMVNKTTEALYKAEQINDELVKKLIESNASKNIAEEKFERIEEEIQDLSMLHQKTQLSFLKK